MKVFEVVASLITERADVCKKVRRTRDEIAKLVDQILKYIDYFNSIEEFDSYVFDYQDMNNVMIPNEFADFIIPRSVKFVPGLRQSTDVLVRAERPKKIDFTLSKWVDLCVEWRSLFKKDFRSDVVTLASLKVDKSIADVLPKACFEGEDETGQISTWARYETSPYVPIMLDTWLMSLYRADYYNADKEQILRDYLSTVMYY